MAVTTNMLASWRAPRVTLRRMLAGPVREDRALMLLMGAFGVVGHHLILLGFRMAPASLLAPFQYLEIVSATAAGFLLFGDFPSPSKWLGIAMIVGAGLYVFWRER